MFCFRLVYSHLIQLWHTQTASLLLWDLSANADHMFDYNASRQMLSSCLSRDLNALAQFVRVYEASRQTLTSSVTVRHLERLSAHVLILSCRHLSFSFFSFPKRVQGKLTFEISFLKVSCVWNSFLQYLPQDLSWGQLSLATSQAFWIRGASQYWWESGCYTICPQGGSTSSRPTLVLPATRALGKVDFLGCELE